MSYPHAEEALAGFFEECRLALFAIRRQFPVLSQPGDHAATLGEVARLAHSIKGTAGLLELPRLAELAGLQEEHWDRLRTGERAISTEALAQAAALTDALDRHVAELAATGIEPESPLAFARELTLQLISPIETAQADREVEPETAATEVAVADLTPESIQDSPMEPLERPLAAQVEMSADLPPLEQPTQLPTDLRTIFLDEAEEHLRSLEAMRVRLEQNPASRGDVLRQAHRAAHSLKGSAGAVGFLSVSRLAHQLEDLLELLGERPQTITAVSLDLWRRTTDLLHALVHLDDTADLQGPRLRLRDLTAAYDEFIATGTDWDSKLNEDAATPSRAVPAAEAEPAREAALAVATDDRRAGDGKAVETRAVEPEAHSLRVPRADVDDLIRLNSDWLLSRSSLEQRLSDLARQITGLERTLGRLRHVSGEIEGEYGTLLLNSRGSGETSGVSPGASGFDPLEFDRYTDFHILTRSLAESTGDFSSLLTGIKGLSGELQALLSQQTRLANQSQKRLVRLRMVAFSRITGRLERAVRQIADDQGKQIDIRLKGEQVEFDKVLLDRLVDPLVHLVRNAADHGVESAEGRRAAGKPPRATLQIEAEYRATEVVVTISDDGQGFDHERIRETAIRRGMLAPSQAAAMSTDELEQLVFAPGFSTAETVSEYSGRGVGLDVVRARVEELRGTLLVETRPGLGTTFRMQFPLTLASTRALLVTCGSRLFALPAHPVRQILRVEPSEFTRLAGRWLVSVGARRLRVTWLGERLNLDTVPTEISRPQPLLILELHGETQAVAVDRIESGREVVVKPLENALRGLPALMGMTVLGTGELVPILDPQLLCGKSRVSNRVPPQPTRPAAAPRGAPLVALADDSVSVRRVLSRLLQSHGYRTVEGIDGLDLIEKLAATSEAPDIVLLDIEMPRLDGYATLAALRDRTEYEELPIVMITSRAGEKHRRRALDLGATEYLVKPWQEETLMALIQRLVNRVTV